MDGSAGIIMIVIGAMAAMGGRELARGFANRRGFSGRNRRYAVLVGFSLPLWTVANLFLMSAAFVWWTPIAALALAVLYTTGTLVVAFAYDAFVGLLIRSINRPQPPL